MKFNKSFRFLFVITGLPFAIPRNIVWQMDLNQPLTLFLLIKFIMGKKCRSLLYTIIKIKNILLLTFFCLFPREIHKHQNSPYTKLNYHELLLKVNQPVLKRIFSLRIFDFKKFPLSFRSLCLYFIITFALSLSLSLSLSLFFSLSFYLCLLSLFFSLSLSLSLFFSLFLSMSPLSFSVNAKKPPPPHFNNLENFI
jgi:hypothetical protein